MLIVGDSLDKLSSLRNKSVHCCVTSPPYWGLRDYGVDGQLGLEKTPDEYVTNLVEVFREVRRVLRDDGTLWLNLGDSYVSNQKGKNSKSGLGNKNDHCRDISRKSKKKPAGLKTKDLVGIPWRVALALQADGWYLRQDIIWHKPNPMPESVKDRCTKSHEYIFLLSKKPKYYFDNHAIEEPAVESRIGKNRGGSLSRGTVSEGTGKVAGLNHSGKPWVSKGTKNKRSVWTHAVKPFKEAHFATFPPGLIEPCILAGCPEGGTVLDPFFGAGTVGLVSEKYNRNWVGIELSQEYGQLALRRINDAHS